MTEPNYESKWWGYIYDQMMEAGLPHVVADNQRFYQNSLRDVSGPVLECACGTGIILLSLLAAGHDIYGFDISSSMLATLEKKAAAQGVAAIDSRISIQDLESFHYDRQFDAILIPTNTFSMLATQEAQVRTLRNIYAHLAPGGKLLHRHLLLKLPERQFFQERRCCLPQIQRLASYGRGRCHRVWQLISQGCQLLSNLCRPAMGVGNERIAPHERIQFYCPHLLTMGGQHEGRHRHGGEQWEEVSQAEGHGQDFPYQF